MENQKTYQTHTLRNKKNDPLNRTKCQARAIANVEEAQMNGVHGTPLQNRWIEVLESHQGTWVLHSKVNMQDWHG